jgi:hypothetical protein
MIAGLRRGMPRLYVWIPAPPKMLVKKGFFDSRFALTQNDNRILCGLGDLCGKLSYQ